MSEESKLNHDESGNVRGTHLGKDEHGITNKPSEESQRQAKVVEESKKQD